MSGPREGQRARFVIEGEVLSAHGRRLDISGGHSVILDNVVSVEVLRPPVKVGDVIETAEELDALPWRAAVVDRFGWVAQRDRHGWSHTGGRVQRTDLPATVLYLPDGAA
jgi:hypothetical protein